MEQIPEWIIKYDQANHQSSAGKAIRFLMKRVIELQDQISNSHKHGVMQGLTDLELLNVLHGIRSRKNSVTEAYHKIKGSIGGANS